MEIRYRTVNDLPVFMVSDRVPGVSKVFGAIEQRAAGVYLFPAFPPFRDEVLAGFEALNPGTLASNTEAIQGTAPEKTLKEWRQEISRYTFPTPSYDHQLDGLAELLYNRRWVLQWQMGTGKSKVVIDALSIIRERALILCPLVAMNNWRDQIAIHSGGTLSVTVLDGKTPAKKRKQLREACVSDVVVATYDLARTYGVPRLHPRAEKLLMRSHVIPNLELMQSLKSLNNDARQEHYVTLIADGCPNETVMQQISAETSSTPTCIEHVPYKIIIPDESHRIKNIQSKRTAFCLQLSSKATRRYALTGTMSHGDPRDVYPQLKFLAPYLIAEDWKSFCRKYLNMSPYNEHIVVSYRNLDILNSCVTKVSSVRLLDECVTLPPRTFVTLRYQLDSTQETDYDLAARYFKMRGLTGHDLDIAHAAITISKLLQLCSGFMYVPDTMDPAILSSQDVTTLLTTPLAVTRRYAVNPKLELLADLLEDLVQGQKKKTIIWANYVAELDDIEAHLRKNNYNYVRVDGTTASTIQQKVTRFQTDPDCQIYLAQEHTGIAVTLTAAPYAVYYSRSWSLDDHQQSLFRNYRIGQKQKTIVYFLVGRDTLEEQQLIALEHKQSIAELLTHRHECAVCAHYGRCLDRDIKPWSDHCILEKNPTRVITRPTPLHDLPNEGGLHETDSREK